MSLYSNVMPLLQLDAEKKQEETLLLSVLPKTIMHRVKEDFRKVIREAEKEHVSKSLS